MADDQTAITKADLFKFGESLTKALEIAVSAKLDAALTPIKANIAKLDEDIDRVLTVLINVDKRLTQVVDDHERRIRRLEQSVGVSA